MKSVLGRLTAAGVGWMSSATDLAVNANQATVANSATAVAIPMVPLLTPRRAARAFVAAPGLNAMGVMASSALRPPRASSSRSGGAVSPAVTSRSTRIASVCAAVRHSSRARSNATTSPSRTARVPASGAPPTRTLRAPRPGWTKNTPSRRPIWMLPCTPSSTTSASAPAPNVTGNSSGPNSRRRPPSSTVTIEPRPSASASAAMCLVRALDGFDADYADRG